MLFHDTGSDFRVANAHGFDFKKDLPRGSTVVDTLKLCREAFKRGFSLRKLAAMIGLPCRHPFGALHLAGNDARYTLQAFLALVAWSAPVPPNALTERRLRLVEHLAQVALGLRSQPLSTALCGFAKGVNGPAPSGNSRRTTRADSPIVENVEEVSNPATELLQQGHPAIKNLWDLLDPLHEDRVAGREMIPRKPGERRSCNLSEWRILR